MCRHVVEESLCRSFLRAVACHINGRSRAPEALDFVQHQGCVAPAFRRASRLFGITARGQLKRLRNSLPYPISARTFARTSSNSAAETFPFTLPRLFRQSRLLT